MVFCYWYWKKNWLNCASEFDFRTSSSNLTHRKLEKTSLLACSRMFCLVKELKLHLKVIVCIVVFLLNSFVLAQNNSPVQNNELNYVKHETNSLPLFLAMTIENATLRANLHDSQKDKFEFLYLHGRSHHVEFDNEEIESKLGSFVGNQDFTPAIPSIQSQVYGKTNQNQPHTVADNGPLRQNDDSENKPSSQNEPLAANGPPPQNQMAESQPPAQNEAAENKPAQQNETLDENQPPSQKEAPDENTPIPPNQALAEAIQKETEDSPSNPENETEYKPSPLPETEYQTSSQDSTENSSTQQKPDLQEKFLDENASQPRKQTENATNFEASNAFQVMNLTTTQNSELNQSMFSPSVKTNESRSGEAILDDKAKYNSTHNEDYSQIYLEQQQEKQQQQQQPWENATPGQVSFESSTTATSYTYPASSQQPFDQTYSQNTPQTTETQQQSYYSQDNTQQQSKETLSPLETASTNSSVIYENPRFPVERKYTNDELQQNPTRLDDERILQNTDVTEVNTSPNLFQEQSTNLNQHTGEYRDQQEQSPIQNTDNNVLRDQQQYSQGPQTNQQPFAGNEELNQESQRTAFMDESNLENATTLPQSQEERFYNQNTTDHLSFSSQEKNEPNLSQLYTTNSQDIARNLLKIQEDPNNVISLLSKVSQLRNEYELATQQLQNDTTDETMKQPENQKTYRRSQIEQKEKIKQFFKKVKKNSHDKKKTRISHKLLQELLNKNDNFETIGKRSQTTELVTRTESLEKSKQDILAKWMDNPSETNFLIRFSNGQNNKNVKGVPEHDLLMKLEAMRYEFLERHNECPSLVIFGTNSDPCYTLTADKSNCAEEFLEVKEAFKQSCPNTKFYIYASKGKEKTIPFHSVQTMTTNGVNVLIS